MMKMMVLSMVVLAGFASAQEKRPQYPTVPPGQTRGEKALKGGPMRYFGDREDQAEVVSVTFLGGQGNEFLCGGGFQRDGTVVLAGNVIGGEFMKAEVLGSDGTKPDMPKLQKAGRGVDPQTTLSWRHPLATGFILRCKKDMAGVLSVVRLPWTSAAITAMEIGSDDSIYIAGKATPDLSRWGVKLVELPANPEAQHKSGMCGFTFLAKLSPDARKIQWVRTLKGLASAPRLQVGRDGTIGFLGHDVRTFTPDGEQKTMVALPGAWGNIPPSARSTA